MAQIRKDNIQTRHIELLETSLILYLCRIGIPQNTIKKIVGVSTNRVNDLAKLIPNTSSKKAK